VLVKLTPTPEEARLEAAALASWAHTGAAVRLIDADISANILDPGRADHLGGELAVSRATFAFPPRSLVAAISSVLRAVQIGDGQRVQAADQQAPALDLRVPRCDACFWCPRARRGLIHIAEPQMERSYAVSENVRLVAANTRSWNTSSIVRPVSLVASVRCRGGAAPSRSLPAR